jgi:tetratricopeptide (TPR) repeat protein
VAGAIETMELALDASLGAPEAYAFTAVELGKLHWSVGRIGEAAAHYRLALQVRPGYAPALDALARVEAARGRPQRALALQRRAVEAIPLPGYVGQLGDLLASVGRADEAKAQVGLVGAIERLQAANGVSIDLEAALYRIDHGIRLGESLRLARTARAARPSVAGDGVLAWALVRNGRCAEARVASERSLRLGQRDATSFFHRGMIERCLGNRAAAKAWFARALDLNPHFSILWAPVARKAVSR